MNAKFTVGTNVYAVSSETTFAIVKPVEEIQELTGNKGYLYKIGNNWYRDHEVFATHREFQIAYSIITSKDVPAKYADYIRERIKEIDELAFILLDGKKKKIINTTFFRVQKYNDDGTATSCVEVDAISFTYCGVDDDNNPVVDVLYHIKETDKWVEALENLEDYTYILTIRALHNELKKML